MEGWNFNFVENRAPIRAKQKIGVKWWNFDCNQLQHLWDRAKTWSPRALVDAKQKLLV